MSNRGHIAERKFYLYMKLQNNQFNLKKNRNLIKTVLGWYKAEMAKGHGKALILYLGKPLSMPVEETLES